MTTVVEGVFELRMKSTLCAWRNLGVQNRQCVAEWGTFEGFFADMGLRPEGLVLAAHEPCQPWSKANCYWGLRYKACVYHAKARIITWNGRSTSIGDWARVMKINPNTLVSRLNRCWDVGRALSPQSFVKAS